MKYISLIFLLLFIVPGCEKSCDESLLIGDMVQIPVEFVDFSLTEINAIKVYRINSSNPNQIDTFYLKELLWAGEARSLNESITDKALSGVSKDYGYYESYLDQCTFTHQGKTISKNESIQIKK